MKGILHEVWVHTGIVNVDEISSLITTVNNVNCLSSPQVCLPSYDYNTNIEGILCPTICTGSKLSCDTSLDCIQNDSSECEYGLYNRETMSCLFYCPEDSCLCSIFTSSTMKSLICECKFGYKKVSDNPPACIESSCEVYHKEGYRYLCDKCDHGMKVGCEGKCCECETGFTAVSIEPLVCLDIGACLAYRYEAGELTCLECEVGYKLSSEGMCDLCDDGYTRVADENLICIEEIEECSSYFIHDGEWRCEVCNEGYKVDAKYECGECKDGYIPVIFEEKLACVFEVEKCLEYELSATSGCKLCEVGYAVDEGKECKICEEGYFIVKSSPLTCAKIIEKCLEYEYIDYDWRCKLCEAGYVLDTYMQCIPCIDQCNESKTCPDSFEDCKEEHSACEICISTPDEVNEQQEDVKVENNNDSISEETIRSRKQTAKSITQTTTAIAATGSIASFNPSTMLCYVNTIKLLSYINLFRLEIPVEVQESQSSISDSIDTYNIFQYIKFNHKNLKESVKDAINDDYSLLYHSSYYILSFLLILVSNLILFTMDKYGQGKIKTICSKVLGMFRYNIYIQYYMLIYLDLCYISLSRLMHPEQSGILNIIDYDIASILSLFLALSPLFLASFLYGNKDKLADEDMIIPYGSILIDYKESLICVYYHVLFLARRLIIAISVTVLKEEPYYQIVLCCVSCIIVNIYSGIVAYDQI